MSDPNDPNDQLQQAMLATRLQGIFMPQGAGSQQQYFPPQNMAQQSDQANGMGDIRSMMDKMETLGRPTTTAQQAYGQQVQQIPQRQNYQPGALRKIAAGLVGLGQGVGPAGMWGGNPVGMRTNPMAGAQAQDAILSHPYNQAMGDWETKTKAMEGPAQLEQRNNTDLRALANNVMQRELQLQNYASLDTARKATADAKNWANSIAQENADTRVYAASIREYAAKNPLSKFELVPGGNIVAFDPRTKTVTEVKGPDGNPIPSGKVSDLVKLQTQLHNRLAEIEAGGEQQRQTVDERGAITGGNIMLRGNEQRKLAEDPNKVRAAEGASSTTKTETLTMPDTKGLFGTTPGKVFKRSTTTERSGKGGVPKPQTIQMKHPITGQVGPVDAANVEEAKRHGYTEVKPEVKQ